MFISLKPLWQRAIAHRGGVWDTPQERNTWRSIALAGQQKLIPEIDLVPLRDGTPVVCHNPWLPKYLRGDQPWFKALVPFMTKAQYEALCHKAGVLPLTLDAVLASVKKNPVLLDIKMLSPKMKDWLKTYAFEPYHRETLRLQSSFSKDIAWLKQHTPLKVWQVIGLDESAFSLHRSRFLNGLSHLYAAIQLSGKRAKTPDGFNIAGNLIKEDGTPVRTIEPLLQSAQKGIEITFWSVVNPVKQALFKSFATVGQVIEGNKVNVLRHFT